MPANRYRYPVGDGIPRQSERTASENKERAYIAASRRSDRSLEARVQSAFAASQIHKERTGKTLKVTEEIVLKEEMYEEEDDLPARYQALMNNPLFALSPRASAYAITQMGMRDAVAARYSNRDPSRLDEVNRQFAQVFPGFGMPPQQIPFGETGAVHSPTAPNSHPSFPRQSPAQIKSPHTPVTQIHQPGFHQHSPPNVTVNSPFGSSPAQSSVDSPASAHSRTSSNTLQLPTTGSSMHARSMSMSQVEPMHMNRHHPGTTVSPVMAPRVSGQRRSYDEAFSSSQSPLMTPAGSGAYPLLSPGMPPPPTFNSNIQRHGSAQVIPMSPGEAHPMHAAGFTTELPANVRDFFMPQHAGESHTGRRKTVCTSSQDADVISHATKGEFQLKGNLRQVQREKKERKRRNTHHVQDTEKAAIVKIEACPKSSSHLRVETIADHRAVKDEIVVADDKQQIKNDIHHTGPGSISPIEQDLTTESASTCSYPTPGRSADNFENFGLDLNSYHAYNAVDFNMDTFNMNFEDNFDMNQFFTFPASQPENDNAQAVS